LKHKIELIYTGGGITLAEVWPNADECVVVSTEAPDVLSVYQRAEDDEPYLPENMIFSLSKNELSEDMKILHAKMLNELKRVMV
jgi:hypothetical protein